MAYVCPAHQTTQDAYCDACMAEFETRKPAHQMTGDERAEELLRRGSIVTMPFDKIHQRIEELVGRPVYTHEMDGRERFAQLIEEARSQDHPSLGEILDKIPGDKPIIAIVADTAAPVAGGGHDDRE